MSLSSGAVWTCILGCGFYLGYSYVRWRRRRSLSLSRERGHEGEINADKWLRNQGFEIVENQVNQEFTYWADGQPRHFRVRPDIMARYQGQRWLIEVKTGKSASPDYPATRRQIREYAQLWPYHRYALFDATQGLFYEVSFKRAELLSWSWVRHQVLSPIALGMLGMGALIGWIAHALLGGGS